MIEDNQNEINSEDQKLQVIETTINQVSKFDITKTELSEIVAQSKLIDVSNLALVKATRLKLRGLEIMIEKKGKHVRDYLTAGRNNILSLEAELKSITTPEIERLEAIEKADAEAKRLQELKNKLPQRLEQLNAVYPDPSYESKVLEMTDNQFDAFYNTVVFLKNQEDLRKKEAELAAERKRIEDENIKREAELAAERKRIEDENIKREAELAAERKAEQDKIDKAKRELEEEKLRLKHEEEVRIAAQQAAEQERLRVEQETKDALARKQAEEQAEKLRLEELERMKPENQKLADYGRMLNTVVPPIMDTDKGRQKLGKASEMLNSLTTFLINE